MPRYSSITIKDQRYESQLFFRRAIAAFMIVLVLIGALITRLVYLQVIGYEHYKTLSHDNRVRLVALPPTRGLIHDRNGRILAENIPSFRLEITAEQVPDMEDTLQRLAALVSIEADDLERFRRLLARKPRFEGVALRFDLNEEEVARLSVNRHLFPGVEIAARLNRYYPYGPRAVHAIGYVGRIDERDLQKIDASNYSGTSHIGKAGIEKSYEDTLHGTVGYQQVEVNAQGRTIRALTETPPLPGQDLQLTIDIDLQIAAEDALEGHNGAIVALDPNNGDILAFVSVPTYDPNLFVQGISRTDYAALSQSENRPLFNRALRGQYPPGSTIKPFMGLAGLELNAVTSEQHNYCPGYYSLPNDSHRYRDWKRTGHGKMDLHDAIVQSCDVYFYDLALVLGIDRIWEFLHQFGLGEKTGIDIFGELSGLLPSRSWKKRARNLPWFPGETLITGIGQGFMLTTPLQLASSTATLATRGQHLQPRLARAVIDPAAKQAMLQNSERKPAITLNNPQHWDQVLQAMIAVVHSTRGTARKISAGIDYQIGGKTGTAQVFGIKQEEKYDATKLAKKLLDHALFIAFAPAHQPAIAVAVVVENGGSGGAVAAPIARTVITHALGEETNLVH